MLYKAQLVMEARIYKEIVFQAEDDVAARKRYNEEDRLFASNIAHRLEPLEADVEGRDSCCVNQETKKYV